MTTRGIFSWVFLLWKGSLMLKAEESGLEKSVEIHMRVVRNGIVVRGCSDGDEVEYVYKDLKEALKEVPSIVSVLSDEEKKVTEDDLDEEEMRIVMMKKEEN